MNVTYIIHDYAGRKGVDLIATVTGDLARLVCKYEDRQGEVGITIIEVKET